MAAHTEQLRSALRQIDSGRITEGQLCDLIKFSRGIIHGHLASLRSSITSICLQQGLTITDLAYDCIAEAFSRDAENRFHKIHNFIGSIDHPLETIPSPGLFLAFKSFLLRFTEAQLARLYSQLDPSGSHIHRNVRESLKDSSLFMLEKDFRGFILVPRTVDPLDHLGPYPQDQLARTLLPALSSRDTIPRMLEVLHRTVSEQSDYRRTIPLIELVWLVKGVFQSDYKPELAVDHPWSLKGFSEEDLRQLRIDVENALKEKILLTYLVKGKVNEKQARGMFNALQDILEEWFRGSEMEDSLYMNLGRHVPIDPLTYEQDFRAKMEYLYRVARQEVASRVMQDL